MKEFVFIVLFIGVNYLCLISQEVLLLKSSGKVVIGDTTQIMTPGNYNLYVQNGILTERVKVALKDASEWSDDAFDKTPSLEDMEHSILTSKHLYEMPSANDLMKEGYELKEMDALLLQQIEWLWQHVIELSKKNDLLARELESVRSQKNDSSSKTLNHSIHE